jgi:hypothetical protein
MAVLLSKVVPAGFEDPKLLYYWRNRVGVSGCVTLKSSDTMFSLCMPSGTVLVVDVVPRYYDGGAFPLIGDSDNESASFSGRDEFIRHYDESDNLTFTVRHDHDPVGNSVNDV